MSINLHLPTHQETLRPTITVIGVGGAGGNAVNNMIRAQLEGVEFVVANTDAQALDNSLTDRVIQLGASLTRGLGAGADPRVGADAAQEALDDISSHIEGSNMVFITAGMGGGTGTGAAPVVAQAAREMGILTIGVVTKPFQFEGAARMRMAEEGLRQLQQYVDTLIVIPNQNLFRLANEKTTFADAFRMADEVLHSGVRGVTDLMVKPGLVNLDFADIRSVMREMGKAMMGTGEATGEKRATDAAESAISNPLLDDVSLKGARAALINITGGTDMTLFEVDEAATRIREEIDPDANIIFGSTFSEDMNGRMRVSVVATGIDAESFSQSQQGGTRQAQGARPFSYGTSGSASNPAKPTTATAPKSSPINVFAPSVRRTMPVQEEIRAAQSEATEDYELQDNTAHNISPAASGHSNTPTQEQPRSRAHTVSVETVKHPEEEEAMQVQMRRAPVQDSLEAAQKAESRTEKARGNLFVSPQAERPTMQRGFRTPYASTNARPSRSKDYQEDEAADDAAQRSEPAGRGLLGRLAEVAQSLSGGRAEESEAPRRASARTVEPSSAPAREAAPEKAADKENYDIPAFLRRQAN